MLMILAPASYTLMSTMTEPHLLFGLHRSLHVLLQTVCNGGCGTYGSGPMIPMNVSAYQQRHVQNGSNGKFGTYNGI